MKITRAGTFFVVINLIIVEVNESEITDFHKDIIPNYKLGIASLPLITEWGMFNGPKCLQVLFAPLSQPVVDDGHYNCNRNKLQVFGVTFSGIEQKH